MPLQTKWTEKRFKKLFDRYNRIYWHGRIPSYVIKIRARAEFMGLCDRSNRTIYVNIHSHHSDKEIRHTLLHEMAHAAASRDGHGHEFFAQLENLLRKGAQMKVGWTEAHYARTLANVVPARFPLARKAMARVEKARARAVYREVRENNLQIHDVSHDEIVRNFADAAFDCLTWKQVLHAVGIRWSLIDDMGRPLDSRSTKIIERGKKAFRQNRRFYLEEQRIRATFEATGHEQTIDKSRVPSAE